MNMGFREGADLAAKLNAILREKRSPDLLAIYDRERRLEWEQLFGLKGEPKASAAASEWIQQRSGRLPACIPASGSDLTLLMRQLNLTLDFPTS